jgi:hypothetical protein
MFHYSVFNLKSRKRIVRVLIMKLLSKMSNTDIITVTTKFISLGLEIFAFLVIKDLLLVFPTLSSNTVATIFSISYLALMISIIIIIRIRAIHRSKIQTYKWLYEPVELGFLTKIIAKKIVYLLDLFLRVVNHKTLIIAANPETSPKTLSMLSKHFHSSIRKAVASNPNSPIETIYELLKEYPHRVVENPVFLLINFSNPNWITEVPEKNITALIDRKDIPVVLLQEIANKYPNYIGKKALIKLAVSSVVTTLILEESILNHGNLYREIINSPKISMNSLKKFAVYGNPNTQRSLAHLCFQSECIFPEEITKSVSVKLVQKHLIECGEEYFVFYALQEKNFPDEYIQTALHLVSNNSLLMLSRYYWHDYPEKLSFYLVRHYISNKDWLIRIHQALAKNPNIPYYVMELLADSEYVAIRANLALNYHLSKNLVIKLANDPYKIVRKRLFSNPNIASSWLIEFATHSDPKVRKIAEQHLNTPKKSA